MYQQRTRHPLSPLVPIEPTEVEDAMWDLFVAVGKYWKLTDDPVGYRGRFKTFMENRISLDPLYITFYSAAKKLIDELTAGHGLAVAYETVFAAKDRRPPTGTPESELEFIQYYVANEFIAFRLALGGFKDFGALNYCGYFGGANITGEPAPYRTF